MIIRLFFKKIIQKCGKDYIWKRIKNKITPENNQICEEGKENRIDSPTTEVDGIHVS